jgi:ATP-dependent DNA helicase RecG
LVHGTNILLTPIEYLKGVGPLKGDLLRKELKLFTFGDLLQFYPFRYIDKTTFTLIKDLPLEGGYFQLSGILKHTEIIGEGRGKRLTAQLKDESGLIELVWFQGMTWIESSLLVGKKYIIYGKVVMFNGYYTITHPEIELLDEANKESKFTLFPVYNSTEKLRAKGLSGKPFAKLVATLLQQISEKDIHENLPANTLSQFNLVNKYVATRHIHFPTTETQLQQATYRLKFEELFIHQIGICKLKLNRAYYKGFQFEKVGDLFNTFYNQYLPFELTQDQKNVIRDVRNDTLNGKHMNRLLQGDVGSGKTIVALLCMLLAIDNGFQACLMAPTEILSQQHFTGILDLLKDLPIRIAILTGTTKGKARKEILQKLAEGEIDLLIGTHSLIEDKVVFKNIGLAIIDEQHRFGVQQRSKLWNKNTLPPHILVMTATPIPRTLAMTSYGDLDISVIKQLPPGRKPISTIHRNELYRAKILDFIKHEIAQGRQAYIVYPLIEESMTLDYENLLAGYEQVRQFFPDHAYNIAMVHGKQDMETREQNMKSFILGKAQILVATTVIEVGVNVPNASVMLIESAERFGLSQLHQLRGRVGRGADKSYCILLTTNKLGKDAKVRMTTMVNESSGFAISEKDLELRGPGEISGLKQSGAAELHIADIVKDVALMETTRNVATAILQQDPFLELDEHATLKAHLLTRKNKEVWSRIS